MKFIPSQEILVKLIIKTGQIKSPEDVHQKLNPQEKQKFRNENDENEPFFPPYKDLKVMPKKINYPDMRQEDFFEITGLTHIQDKYAKKR